MIHSLFIATNSRNICMEKHWRNVINKSVCDYFFDIDSDQLGEDCLPVVKTPHHFLVNIFRENVHYIAVCGSEVPPLFVIEFLHRLVDVLLSYFGSATETVIRDNMVRIYEILDEMLDNGFPLATETNVLQELVRPPSVLRVLADAVLKDAVTLGSNLIGSGVTGGEVGRTLPLGQLSSVPWRRSGVSHSRNEAFFDVVERLSICIDRAGCVSRAEVDGHIDCHIRLSGSPDLTMRFVNPNILEEVSLHPCVRYSLWQRERILSFVPPDGKFRLMTFHSSLPTSSGNAVLPINIRGNVTWADNGSRLEIVVSSRKIVGKIIDKVAVTVRMPPSVTSVSGLSNVGRCQFDHRSHHFRWSLGRLEPNLVASVRASISLGSEAPLPVGCSPLLEADFVVMQYSVSGIKVARLDLHVENYKPFKGVKYITKSGNVQVAT